MYCYRQVAPVVDRIITPFEGSLRYTIAFTFFLAADLRADISSRVPLLSIKLLRENVQVQNTK